MIAEEQVRKAQELAQQRLNKEIHNRPDVSYAHQDTANHLTGNISDGEGVESAKLSIKDSKKIAKEAKSEGFDPEKYGYSKDPLLEEVKINYANEAIKAGLTAAAITVAIQLTPEIYKAIDYLIKNGEIDTQQIQKAGIKGLSSGAESFLQGSISYALIIKCQTGALGAAFQSASPSLIGALTVLILQTVKNSILVAAGKMTAQQMGAAFVDTVVISGGYVLGTYIGGVIGQAIGFEFPVIGYLIGSLIGTAFCVLYNVGKKTMISLCVDTGFTCFGLVDQNYELPEEIIKELGVDTIPIPRADVDTIDIPRTNVDTATIERTQYETVSFTMVKRGVIGVNKVGYVLA